MVGSECILETFNYDIVALLDSESIQHEAIATKIITFVGRIAHIVMKDMICTKKHEELEIIRHESKTKTDTEEVNSKNVKFESICNFCSAKYVKFMKSRSGCHIKCLRC